jgi:hypothetical protein
MDKLKPLWRTKTDSDTAGPVAFDVGPLRYQRISRSAGLFVGAWILTLCPVVQPVDGQETPEIAKQAQNPIASLISVPFENDFNPQAGFKKEDG